jgi:acyl carrier protein
MADNLSRSVVPESMLAIVLDAYRQGLENPEVNPTDDFFEVGGDSVQALNVLAILEEKIGVNVNIGVFFACPTAAELATAIQNSDTN